MTKEKILSVFEDINLMYNNPNMYDVLSKMLDKLVEDSKKTVEPEKCGDCVNRQAVLDLAKSGKLVSNWSYKSVCDAINGLPSVEPKQKKGHWIMQNDRSKKLLGWSFCSECNAWIGEPTDYCSNCGADMREVDNE